MGLLLSVCRDRVLTPRSAAPLQTSSAGWFTGDFRPGAHFDGTDPTGLPPGVRTIGSWIGGDQWQGDVVTNWAPVVARQIDIFVAGYPQLPGCALRAEFRDASDRVTAVRCEMPSPHEMWKPWHLSVPPDGVAMRLVAADHNGEFAGWLAFSEPVIARPAIVASAYMAAQVFTTVALALTLVWGPGLLWAQRTATPERRALAILGAGPLMLVAMGLLVWAFDGSIRPHHLAFALTAVVWVVLGWRLWRVPPAFDSPTGTILAVTALLLVALAAKATYSAGPDGELYGGTISRTLTVGDRSDARISFHVVQTAAHHLAPWDSRAERYFSPWTFFSRGPLAGLAATPVALATSGRPPLGMPDGPWTPFDTTGFAAYRILLMALGSTVVFALFAALRNFTGDRWAVIGAGVLALCPFTVHESLFTWPKLEATACLLMAFLLVHQRRPLAGGIAVGIGYLFHPLAALWTPWLALWGVARATHDSRARLLNLLTFGVGVGALVVPWMLAGKLAPHDPTSTNAGQVGFISYFLMANGGPAASLASWWQARCMNFANTFIPFWLYTQHADQVGSVYGPVGPLVKFAFSWWNTLPLGLGLVLWGSAVILIVQGLRRHLAPISLLLLGPALLLLGYWGAHATGLLRECGHPLFVAIIGVTIYLLSRSADRLARFVSHESFAWLQLPEVLLMLWLTTLANPHPHSANDTLLDPLYLAINVLALAAVAALLARFRLRTAGRR